MDGIFTTRFVDPYLRFHKYIYEKSDGRIGKHSNRVPALLLTTTGRRSGLAPHQRPDLLPRPGGPHRGGLQRGERPAAGVAAQPAGRPEVTVRVGRQVLAATARVADPEERAQLWPLVNRTNRGMARIFHPGVRGRYDVYQRHTAREIPVVIITPARARSRRGRRPDLGRAPGGQSSRSGCSRTIRSNSGWKLNQPAGVGADLPGGEPGHLRCR